MKPLGRKSYGSIPHLSSSKLGPGDYHCSAGQERIATVKTRDRHDLVIIQEKLDGGNVAVAKLNGEILALTRFGYLALSSPFSTHHIFHEWVALNEQRFKALLTEGERVCGEWLYHAVGTLYQLPHEPFIPFDLMLGSRREPYAQVSSRLLQQGFTPVNTIHTGGPLPVNEALQLLGPGKHGAVNMPEGLIYRVERKGEVDFLCKYVRHEKENGIYLPEISGKDYVINLNAGRYL